MKNYEWKMNLLFFIPTFFWFVVINFYRMMPNWGDSNKFFLYHDMFLCLFAGFILLDLYKKSKGWKLFVIVILLISSIIPSVLIYRDVFYHRLAYALKKEEYPKHWLLFTQCEKEFASWIKNNTRPEDIFLTSDDVIHFLPALTGRRVVDGAYTDTNGLVMPLTKSDVRRIFKTGDIGLIKKYNISYILIGPKERRRYQAELSSFNKFKKVCELNCPDGVLALFSVQQEDQLND